MSSSPASRGCPSSVYVSVDDAGSPEQLFARHHPPLLRYLARLTGDQDLAADVAQEAFVRLLERRPDPEAARPWLFRVATNLVRDTARRNQRHRLLLMGGRSALAHGEPAPPPDRGLDREACRELVRQAMQALSPKERQALLMREEGFAHREIAAALGTTTGSIGTLLRRALAKAADRLGPPPEEA